MKDELPGERREREGSETSSQQWGSEGSVTPALRCEIALDEDDHEAPAHLFMYEQNVMRAQPVPDVEPAPRHMPSSEDYYPHVSITALMKILRDTSLSAHHSGVTHTLMLIFKGDSLLIYICNFHVSSHLLLIYICKLHWNLNTMFVCQVILF